ncbi:MAG: thioredoxin family protein [Desulfobacterales bacterium]
MSKDEKIIKFGVSLTPSVVIDGQIKAMGRIPKKDEVFSWLMHKKIPKSKAA